MSPENALTLRVSKPRRDWIAAALLLAVAVAATLLLAQLLFAPPANDLSALAIYIVINGVQLLDSVFGYSVGQPTAAAWGSRG